MKAQVRQVCSCFIWGQYAAMTYTQYLSLSVLVGIGVVSACKFEGKHLIELSPNKGELFLSMSKLSTEEVN